MTVYLPAIANSVNSLPATKFELHLIGANARGLKSEGRELMPVKADMLHALPEELHGPVLEACELLFAAVLAHVDASLRIPRAKHAPELVKARMQAAQATGTVCSLFHGLTAPLLVLAMECAPIAFYAMAEAAPDLRIIDRVTAKQRALHSPSLARARVHTTGLLV
jgi:hypothetical protein